MISSDIDGWPTVCPAPDGPVGKRKRPGLADPFRGLHAIQGLGNDTGVTEVQKADDLFVGALYDKI
jgi:hypothetical protein